MDAATAGLRIKFIPIMKDLLEEDNKCCLEIVPEVSGIQNIDQIDWKDENNSIEYIIPMTYKIILKKLPPQTIKEMNENLNKMYYSCVDLTLPSSITSLNLASGDVKRIISDTYAVTKVTANADDINDMQWLGLNGNEDDIQQEPTNNQNIKYQKPVETELTESSINKDQTREDDKNRNQNDKASDETSIQNMSSTINANRQSVDEITNIESDFALYTDAYTQSGDTLTCVSTIMNSSKAYCRKKLSQTPICSVDTDVVKEKVSTNSVVYYIKELHKGAACIANICTVKNIYHENYAKNNVIPEQMQATENHNNAVQHFTRRKRILPEIRVAELMQVMEKEIMPLKIMLNDILTKCATLGLTNRPQLSLMYKSIDPRCNDVTKIYKKPLNSNRVVYSIVFDG